MGDTSLDNLLLLASMKHNVGSEKKCRKLTIKGEEVKEGKERTEGAGGM